LRGDRWTAGLLDVHRRSAMSALRRLLTFTVRDECSRYVDLTTALRDCVKWLGVEVAGFPRRCLWLPDWGESRRSFRHSLRRMRPHEAGRADRITIRNARRHGLRSTHQSYVDAMQLRTGVDGKRRLLRRGQTPGLGRARSATLSAPSSAAADIPIRRTTAKNSSGLREPTRRRYPLGAQVAHAITVKFPSSNSLGSPATCSPWNSTTKTS
jgi:hypothetical protein